MKPEARTAPQSVLTGASKLKYINLYPPMLYIPFIVAISIILVTLLQVINATK